MHSIFEIDVNKRTPKYLQIVHSVTKSIKLGKLKKGDKIYSINELSNEFMLSRDTVQKAYEILQKDKIIAGVRGKGFYINRTDLFTHYNILLVFNKLSHYKKVVYDSFVKTLGSKAAVELKIHHSDVKIFEDIITSSLGEYDYYAIMPHFYNQYDKAIGILKQIPVNQLLLLDKDLHFPDLDYAAVYQDFENDIAEAFEKEQAILKKYSELIMVHPQHSYPLDSMNGFKKFCMQYQFKHKIIETVAADAVMKKGEAYVVIEESDLANIIKCCRNQGLKIGKDVGIISYNDTPLKEILLDGITVISTDHEKMGETAARFILDNKKEKIRNPFRFLLRNSL